jgi:hypothetical protein
MVHEYEVYKHRSGRATAVATDRPKKYIELMEFRLPAESVQPNSGTDFLRL